MAAFQIESFTLSSPGAQAGLALGDRITHINGREYNTLETMIAAIIASGGSFTVSYLRAGARDTVGIQGDSLGCKLIPAPEGDQPLPELPVFEQPEPEIAPQPEPIIRPDPVIQPEPIATPRMRYAVKHTYQTDYPATRTISVALSIIGWLVFWGSIIAGGFIAIKANPPLGLAVMSGCISGLMLIHFANIGITTADTADHTREIMNLLASQQHGDR